MTAPCGLEFTSQDRDRREEAKEPWKFAGASRAEIANRCLRVHEGKTRGLTLRRGTRRSSGGDGGHRRAEEGDRRPPHRQGRRGRRRGVPLVGVDRQTFDEEPKSSEGPLREDLLDALGDGREREQAPRERVAGRQAHRVERDDHEQGAGDSAALVVGHDLRVLAEREHGRVRRPRQHLLGVRPPVEGAADEGAPARPPRPRKLWAPQKPPSLLRRPPRAQPPSPPPLTGFRAPRRPQVSRELASHSGYLSCCRFIENTEILTSSGARARARPPFAPPLRAPAPAPAHRARARLSTPPATPTRRRPPAPHQATCRASFGT